MYQCLLFYCRLLDSKRKELGDAASKLSNGLSKLIETREKVEAMTIELEGTKVKLAQFQKECDEYLVSIVQQKRDAEEQEKVRVRMYVAWGGGGGEIFFFMNSTLPY